MSIFVDANVIVYTTTEGPLREPCRQILAAIDGGELDGVTSTAALEEIWHLELSGKIDDAAGLAADAYAMFTPLLPITDVIVARALDLDAGRLGANDRIHVATCLENGVDTIVSADAGFDGVRGIKRVDPLDERAVRRLLRS